MGEMARTGHPSGGPAVGCSNAGQHGHPRGCIQSTVSRPVSVSWLRPSPMARRGAFSAWRPKLLGVVAESPVLLGAGTVTLLERVQAGPPEPACTSMSTVSSAADLLSL